MRSHERHGKRSNHNARGGPSHLFDGANGAKGEKVVADLLLRATRDAGFTSACLYVVSADDRYVVSRAHFGDGCARTGRRWPIDGDAGLRTLLDSPRSITLKGGGGAPGRGPLLQEIEAGASRLWLPLRAGGKVVGGMLVGGGRDDSVAKLRPLLTQAAESITQNREIASLVRKARNLNSVLQISTKINSSLSLSQILNVTCQSAKELIKVDHCGFVLFDRSLATGKVYAEFPDMGAVGRSISLRTPAGQRFIKSREPLVVADVARDPALGEERASLLELGIRSTLIMPVMARGKILGSFGLDAMRRRRPFTDEEIELCRIFAEQVAAAITNARAYTDAKRQAEQLLRGTASERRDHLLHGIVERAVRLLKAKSGGIYQYDAEAAELTVIIDYNRQSTVGKTLKLGEGMAGRLIKSRKPFMIVDDYNAWKHRARIYEGGRKFGAVLEVPLRRDGVPYGVLFVEDDSGRKFTPEDARLLVVFANQAAVALHKPGRLFHEEVKWRRQEQLSHATFEIMESLRTTTLEQRLTLIAAAAARVLGAESCGVFLVKDRVLSLEASYGHREGGFKRGLRLPLREGSRGGLTAYIAQRGRPFRRHGEALTGHAAVSHTGAYHTPSRECYSILAIPLYERAGGSKRLIGLLRVDNKRGPDGEVGPDLYFTEEDEWNLKIFAEAAIVAIGSTILVEQLRQTQRSLSDVVGLLDIGEQRGRVGQLSQVEIDLVGGVTTQANKLVERLKLADEQEQQLIRIRRANETAERVAALTALGEREETLRYVAEGTQAELGSDGVILYTYDQEKGLLNYPPVHAGTLLSDDPWPPGEIPRSSITYKMLAHDDVCIVNDTATDPAFCSRPFRERERVASCVASPLIAMGQRVGVMFVNYCSPHSFTDEEVQRIKLSVNQAAVAIHKAQLFEQAQKRERVIEAFYSAGRAITSSLRQKTTLNEITSQALWIVGEAGGRDCFSYVALLRGDTFEVVSASPQGMLKPVKNKLDGLDTSRPAEEIGITGRAAKLGVTQNVSDVRHDADYILLRPSVKVQLSVPLKIDVGKADEREKVIGVLSIERARPIPFGPEDQRNVELLATLAALAIQNAENYEATQREKERLEGLQKRLEGLHRAARAMAAQFELRSLLPTVVERACDVLEADSAVLMPYESRQRRFIPNEPTASGISDGDFRAITADEDILRVAAEVLRQGWLPVCDVSDRARRDLSRPARRKLSRAGIAASQGIALRVGKEAVGVLFANYGGPRGFTDEDRRQIEGFASYAALSLKKSRLLWELDVARTISGVVAKLSLLGDKRNSLNMIAGGSLAAAKCDSVVMYIYDLLTGKFEPEPVVVGEPKKITEVVRPADRISPDSVVHLMRRRKKPYRVESVADDPLFSGSSFVRAANYKSCLVLPLTALGQKVGVMFLNYSTPHHFTSDEIKHIWDYVNQISVVIFNAQMFEQAQTRERVLEGLRVAGQAMTSSLRLRPTLDEITRRALQIVAGGDGFCFSHVALLNDGVLDFISVSPEEFRERYAERLTSSHLRRARKGRIGIAGRVAKRGKVLNVPDVHVHPDYSVVSPEINSQLSVPLKVPTGRGGRERRRVIGVLSIEHERPAAFNDEDQRNVELLASQAAVAIQNAQQFEELERTKGLVGSRTALAWMGMTSNVWRHAIVGYAANIQNNLFLLRGEIEQAGLAESELRALEGRLRLLERQAANILDKDIAPPYASAEGVDSFPINEFLHDRVQRLRENQVYPEGFEVELIPCRPDPVVRCSRNWLREAFDILIENAIEATEESRLRRLTISTRVITDRVEVAFTDTGRGIPPDVYEKLFRERIRRRRTKGLGVGLLMVQAIMQAYGGDIRAASPGPGNTTFVMQLRTHPKGR